MYSAKLIEGENRILIQCNFLRKSFVKFSAVYDTGAQLTCVTAAAISTSLKEEDFINSECEVMTVAGLIDANNVQTKYYRLFINDFYLGNIHITGVDIWVTFDDRITDSVVGMDVLSRVTRLGIANDNKELFFKDTQELFEYCIEYIADEQVLQANYFNKKLNKNT